MKTFPISALPLAAKPQLLIHSLTPDTLTPSPKLFRTQVISDSPSLQRRARLLPGPAHFSHVSPFPLPFPYNIESPVPTQSDSDKPNYIEQWLADREARHSLPPPTNHPNSPLTKYAPKNRDQPLDLLAVSKTGLADCVPHLDVGDAFDLIGTPSLSSEFDDEGDPKPSSDQLLVHARQDLIDILSGHCTLMSSDDSEDRSHVPFAPWSLRYSGHQFGSWAGQLGDGRAITIHVTPHPSDPQLTYELQLKGSGRTPFSRSADGLAVLRSSIREYLCSEAMHALHIPTTRSLSLISLPALPVQRERVETACVLTRIAPSFIRIGNFEAFNGPTNMFFFGGGQQKPDYDGLLLLGEWVSRNVLKLPIEEDKAWGAKLVFEVARRNALMVAAWQAYGFMHGVINTDNVSVLGLTIDYGPYAFMDVFDSLHICNHTDESGRYAYKYQPNMIIYAIRALLNALAPIIGAESGENAVKSGWAEGISAEKLEEWTKKGLGIRDEAERIVQETAGVEYGRLMRKRLGLRRQDGDDEVNLFRSLLDILERHALDFHTTFRTLCYFRPSILHKEESEHVPAAATVTNGNTTAANTTNGQASSSQLEAFVARLLKYTADTKRLDYFSATREWVGWLERYSVRIQSERDLWASSLSSSSSVSASIGLAGAEAQVDVNADIDKHRGNEMKHVNPRFVLRQWVLEDVIARVERDADSGKRVLAKVMHMACNPYEPWGGEAEDGNERPESELDKEAQAERRYCSLGEKKMLGFQCSCSS